MSGINGDMAELLSAAETDGLRVVEEILKDVEFVEANGEKCIKASSELYSVLERCTNSGASTIVTELEEWKDGRSTCENCSRRTLGRMFWVQRACMYPKLVKDVSQVRLVIMQCEEKWNAMMLEIGNIAKIPDVWRMPVLLEQMLMRMDEIGENYENLKAKAVSYTANKTEQARG